MEGRCKTLTTPDGRGRSRTRINRTKRNSSQVMLRDEKGHKFCVWGEHWSPESWFSANNNATDKLHSYCRRCITLIKHNLSPSDYTDILESQNGKCPICQVVLRFDSPIKNRPCIDHDHECCPQDKSCGKCVRGVVCFDCNVLLGKSNDSVDTLLRAIAYLKEWKAAA